jgi:hypothetical protein
VKHWIRTSPILPWIFLFVALSLAVTQYGGENAKSRDSALRAITEAHTFSIDNYADWTLDWALAPNGHYYSNKAPGPVLLGLPMFALTDAVVRFVQRDRIDQRGRAPQPGYADYLPLMLWLQILPFAFLVLLIARELPSPERHFFALAALFGNTAAIYMSSNFGHGVASLLFLGAAWFWWERRYGLTGFFLSWALLSDYGVAFALPFFLIATVMREKTWKSLLQIALGAAPGAVVWIWYHTTFFGSPFHTANQFTNHTQIETLPNRWSLWGEFSPFPSPEILARLLFGTERGILFTQPWMLAVFALPFLRKTPKAFTILAAGSLAGLLWMNGGFGGWHGGWCVGPRYPSVVYPTMALAIALCWRQIPNPAQAILWATLIASLAFRVLVFPFSNMAPLEPLWPYHLGKISEHPGTTALRGGIALALIAAALLWQRRQRGFPFFRESV